jgi:hypothetical protein
VSGRNRGEQRHIYVERRHGGSKSRSLEVDAMGIDFIAKAKAEGKYRGGIPTARAKAKQVIALVDAGKTKAEVAEELGISIRSVFRILRTRKDAEKASAAPPVTRIRTRPQIEA